MNDIYLDFNATTPPDERVVEAMLPFLTGRFGNAASSHPRGRAAAGAVDRARSQVAELVGVVPARVVWTSGATEALNTALKGLAERRAAGRDRLLVSAAEHKAVLDVAEWLSERRGVEVVSVPVTSDGVVDVDALEGLLDERVFAVGVMAASNETGVLNPVEEVAELVGSVGAHLVCDTTQAVGKVPVEVPDATFCTVSAHKLYGPQGVGALVLPERGRGLVDALLHGGGHERGVRSGTLNLAGVVGFGEACQLAGQLLEEERVGLGRLRDELERVLVERLGAVVHGAGVDRLSNTTNVWLPGVDADALIANTPGVAFSSGSACTAAVPTPSHVLTAMGLAGEAAEESVRLSVGRGTSDDDIRDAVELLAVSVARIRELNGAA